jgi:hypothetical protein
VRLNFLLLCFTVYDYHFLVFMIEFSLDFLQEFDDRRDAEDAMYDMNGKDLCGDRWVRTELGASHVLGVLGSFWKWRVVIRAAVRLTIAVVVAVAVVTVIGVVAVVIVVAALHRAEAAIGLCKIFNFRRRSYDLQVFTTARDSPSCDY